MATTDLTSAESRVWRAFARGNPVDFSRPDDEEAENGHAWGPVRTVRAKVLRTLLLVGDAEEGEIAALRILGARITGVLDLQFARVDHLIRLSGCHFENPPILYGAQVRQLNLSRSYLPALDAGRLHVDGVLRITGCRVPGEIRLGGARVSGAFFLDGAQLGDEDEDHKDVLYLNYATIDHDVVATELRVHGGFLLNDTTVSGSIQLTKAALVNPAGTALRAHSLSVGSDLQATDMRVRGQINLRGARIDRRLNLNRTSLSNPGGTALRASSCVIGEVWLRDAPPIEGVVILRRSQVDMLYAPPDVWPNIVEFDGFTYASLMPHLPASQRLPMLESEADGYVPYAYEQLTAAYRRIGDDTAARSVQLAKQRRHRATLPWYAKLWGYLQDGAVGYGFRPMRAAGWLVTLLLVGAIAYGLEHPYPLKPGEAPTFNPLFYTFDLLLPIIDFGQEKAFKPQGWYQWLSYALILAGWILATTIIAGVTRAVSLDLS